MVAPYTQELMRRGWGGDGEEVDELGLWGHFLKILGPLTETHTSQWGMASSPSLARRLCSVPESGLDITPPFGISACLSDTHLPLILGLWPSLVPAQPWKDKDFSLQG